MASSDDVKAGYWICTADPFLPVVKIRSELFTHLYAGFAVVQSDGGVTIPRTYEDQFRTFTQIVRQRSSQVKTVLSIGGAGCHTISAVVKNADKRAKLISDSIDLARKYDFDGLDLCWVYPSPSDKGDDLDSLLNDWYNAVSEDADLTRSKPKLLLTAAVFHHPVIPGRDGSTKFSYPIQAIKDNLDWINVQANDFHTPSNSSQKTGPVHTWLNPSDPNRCGRAGIQDWIDKGVATKQIVFSLPFYGYEWSLTESNNTGFFAPAHPASQSSKTYRTIQEIVQKNKYATVYDSDYYATYSYKKKSWIGYDDVYSISKKVEEAIGNTNLGGYFASNMGADDVNWTLSTAALNAWKSAYHALLRSNGCKQN